MSDTSQTDALAAEYVLGTLDADERAVAQALMRADEEFVAKVKQWERRLGELHLMVEPVEPEAGIWERIKSKMPPPSAAVSVPEPQVLEPQVLEPKALEPQALEPQVLEPAAPPAAALPPTVLAPPTAAVPEGAPAVVASAASEASPPAPDPAVAPPPAPPPSPPPLSPPAPPLAPPAPAKAPPPASAQVAPAAPEETVVVLRRRLRRWRALVALMSLLILVAAGLVGAWKFAPDELPTMLQPVELLRSLGAELPAPPPSPRRPPAPPESQFDE